VFLLAGELVKGEVAHTLMQLVAEGTGDEDDEAADTQLRRDAVENYARLLDKPVLPDVLVQTMSWVLGEYGYLSQAVSQVQISDRSGTRTIMHRGHMRIGRLNPHFRSQAELIRKLCTIAHRKFSDAATRGFVIYSVVKLVAQIGEYTVRLAAHGLCKLADSPLSSQAHARQM
jgi:AP-4 complex subunit epsilon-1